jgi:hypothetical protein
MPQRPLSSTPSPYTFGVDTIAPITQVPDCNTSHEGRLGASKMETVEGGRIAAWCSEGDVFASRKTVPPLRFLENSSNDLAGGLFRLALLLDSQPFVSGGIQFRKLDRPICSTCCDGISCSGDDQGLYRQPGGWMFLWHTRRTMRTGIRHEHL